MLQTTFDNETPSGEVGRAVPGPVAAWVAVALLCLAQVISTIDRGMLALVVDPVRADLGISEIQIALLQGFAFSVFYVIAGVVLGLVADLVNRKRLLVLGIVIWSAATICSGIAQTYVEMFGARLFIGIGEAVLAPCAVTIIADLFPAERRGRPMALYVFGSMIAFGVGSLLTGFVLEAAPRGAFAGLGPLATLAPWRIAFVLAGLAGIVLAIGIAFLREPPRKVLATAKGATDSVGAAFGHMVRQWRVYLPFYLTLAMFGMGASVGANWGAMLLTRVFHLPIDEASKMLGTAQILWAGTGALLAGLVIDRIAKRWGARGKIVFAALLCLASLPSVMGVLATGPLIATALVTEITFVAVLFGSTMLSLIAEITPLRIRGLAVSLYAFFMTLIGASFGPILVAFLTEHLFGSREAVGQSMAIVGAGAFIGGAVLAACAARGLHRLDAE